MGKSVDFSAHGGIMRPTMRLPGNAIHRFRSHMPDAFSLSGFWRVLGKLARRGGRELVYHALTLFFCLRDPATPASAKSLILGALGYLILPVDFIPDALIGAGFTDDWSVILGAVAAVASHIKQGHREKAAGIADRILGGEAPQEIADPAFTAMKP